MKIIIFLITFFIIELAFLGHQALAQEVDLHTIQNHEKIVLNRQKQSIHSTLSDSATSEKLSIAPIVAFGFAGMLLGGIIGSKIDQGSYLDITKTELTGMVLGTAIGVTIGYILAKENQKRKERLWNSAECFSLIQASYR